MVWSGGGGGQRWKQQKKKSEGKNLQLSDDNLHRWLRLLAAIPSLISVSQQSDSFPRQPNVLGPIETEESGQESGNVDRIQNHQNHHCVDSPQSGPADGLRGRGPAGREGRGEGGQRL